MLHASVLIPLLLAATTAEKKGEDALPSHDGSLVIGDVDPATTDAAAASRPLRVFDG